ncbi:hypothetical protein BLS_001172 [Venturia inaequalis]|uniref:N-alpha-acetyltransferase 40 n=1 Tax=Venturia inaequalis TaxID=5025 RepID=A0A8H3UZT1_VENIN|nr:hypothetical protein BLS_001172 [Venturia inaequalis]RDI85066.1 hypothetical protein Vi05172_g5067 [Venturia inaequalis]
MSPLSTLKRRSLRTNDQKPQKRSKLSMSTTSPMSPNPSKAPITLDSPPNPLKSRTRAALNLIYANSLSSTQFTQQYIPTSSQRFTAKDGHSTYTCTFKRTQDVTPEEKEACFQIIRETSRRDYEANAEQGWDDERKRGEMGEEGMKFLLVKKAEANKQDENSSQILGFTSFTLEMDPDNQIPQLYVYEIHLLPSARSLGLGRHLMSLNEVIARELELEKVILTVFTCNTKAEGLYRRLGYGVDEQSPKERVLRSGKVVRPKYLILSKALS